MKSQISFANNYHFLDNKHICTGWAKKQTILKIHDDLERHSVHQKVKFVIRSKNGIYILAHLHILCTGSAEQNCIIVQLLHLPPLNIRCTSSVKQYCIDNCSGFWPTLYEIKSRCQLVESAFRHERHVRRARRNGDRWDIRRGVCRSSYTPPCDRTRAGCSPRRRPCTLYIGRRPSPCSHQHRLSAKCIITTVCSMEMYTTLAFYIHLTLQNLGLK